jgi:hypothetical protein
VLALAFLIFMTVLGISACRMFYQAGCKDGYAAAVDIGSKYHAMRIARINVALGTLSPTQIYEALTVPTTDKVSALLAALDRNSTKALGDAKARAAEFAP